MKICQTEIRFKGFSNLTYFFSTKKWLKEISLSLNVIFLKLLFYFYFFLRKDDNILHILRKNNLYQLCTFKVNFFPKEKSIKQQKISENIVQWSDCKCIYTLIYIVYFILRCIMIKILSKECILNIFYG